MVRIHSTPSHSFLLPTFHQVFSPMNLQILHSSRSLCVPSMLLAVLVLFNVTLSLGQSGPARPQTGVNPSSDAGQPIAEPSPRADGSYPDAPEATSPPDAAKGHMLNFSFGE